MIITEVTKNIQKYPSKKRIDFLSIEWYETTKRIQRLRTNEGMDIAIKFIGKTNELKEGDILFEDDQKIVVVSVKPCEVIWVSLNHSLHAAFIAQEIGNKHAPLFIEDDKLLMPFERATFQWFEKKEYKPQKGERKLLQMLQANVDPKQPLKSNFSTKKPSLLLNTKL